ncbi:MAG: hypothetical protein QHI48_00975 [Bacteroidota bacterium]|nr:hypothetical protein [Bacteroidota bacterium]
MPVPPTDGVHLIATAIELTCAVMLAGISWYRTLVHVPLLRTIPPDSLPLHARSIAVMDSIILYPLMVVETISAGLAAAIVFQGFAFVFEQVSFVSLVGIWLPVLFVARPALARLSYGSDAKPFRAFLAAQRWLAVWWSVRGVFLIVLFLCWTVRS